MHIQNIITNLIHSFTVILFCIISFLSYDAHASKQAAIASAHPFATQAGLDILSKGGNAFDAAVAVSSTIGVVEPYGSGIGGGGFFLLYHAKTKTYRVIDARETAPIAAHKNMYLDENGNAIKGASTNGPLSAGIPGMPAAWEHIQKQYGVLDLNHTLAPAISYAQNGVQVGERYISGIKSKYDQIQKNQSASDIFLDNGKIPNKGWTLKQDNLAKTLALIASKGAQEFYNGSITQKLVKSVTDNGGIWSLDDFKTYKIIERDPVHIKYDGANIIAPPLPSSGGLVLKNILNILSHYELNTLPGIQKKHLLIEAMRHAYYNRALYMGDSDFVDVPIAKITGLEMAHNQNAMIDPNKALSSATLTIPHTNSPKGTETTHFSIIDKHGNIVAATQSINFWFGSGFVAQDTGVLLNNEMDDFTIKPGAANGYGLVGTIANGIEPKKRMLSSMTPLIVNDGDKIAILGTPGGSRIISMNFLATLSFLNGLTGDEIVSTPRFHHQYLPDKVIYEDGAITEDEKKALQNKGHILEKSKHQYGNMQIIIHDHITGKSHAYSDPRGEGAGRVY